MNKENKLGMGLGALLSTPNNNSESSNGIQKINISENITSPELSIWIRDVRFFRWIKNA